MPSDPTVHTGAKPNLFGLDARQLGEFVGRFDVPPFHAEQIFRWLYAKRRFNVESGWTDLSSAFRVRIVRAATVDPGRIAGRIEAPDGTVKYRLDLAGGGQVEAVHMMQSERVTLCLSSQVGCALDCDFCLTGKMGFTRNLTPGEIVGQVALLQEDRDLDPSSFNLVFMGMGEPLHNYDAVVAAIGLLTDPKGFGLSRRRITLSTSGLAPAIERLASEPVRPRLAVSLNATSDEVRDRLMPVNRKYPIRRLLEACRAFAAAAHEPLTFEYVLLEGINDSLEDVRRLARIVRGLPSKLNLIPFNPVPGWLAYRPPSRRRILDIRSRLLRLDVPVSIRWSRGVEARAACGQLALLPDAPADAAGPRAAKRRGR